MIEVTLNFCNLDREELFTHTFCRYLLKQFFFAIENILSISEKNNSKIFHDNWHFFQATRLNNSPLVYDFTILRTFFTNKNQNVLTLAVKNRLAIERMVNCLG